MTEPLIETHSLTRSFGEEVAVDQLDLQVRPGEVHAIVGLNGAGKTTLMRLLLGMLRPGAGRAVVMGHDVSAAPPEVWSRVGHLVETPFAYPELTLEENLTAAALLHGLSTSHIPDLVARALDEYHLGRWSGRRSRTLSLGNRQRLGIAAALIHKPSVLILDEPANSLDPAGVVFIRDLLTTYAREGAGVLVSSHHLDQLARIANRITVLHSGRRVGGLEPGGADLEKRFFDLVYEADLASGGGAP